MQDPVLQSGWDTVVVVVPFLVIVTMGIFRLDSILASPRTGEKLMRTIYGNDINGEPVCCDPDGRPWAGSGSRG